jgi:hypothetical protein
MGFAWGTATSLTKCSSGSNNWSAARFESLSMALIESYSVNNFFCLDGLGPSVPFPVRINLELRIL